MEGEKLIINELADTLSSSGSERSEGSSEDIDYEFELLRERKIARIENFVENTLPQYTEKVFQSHFRISRDIVYCLIDRLERSAVIPSHDDGKEKITAEKSLLLTLWYLSNTETFRQISDRFNVSLSSAHRSLLCILNYVLSIRTEFIIWPTLDRYEEIRTKFARKQGIDDIVGAIDGCHVRIRRAQQHQEVYINRNKYRSVLLQGIVDHEKHFLDVYCGEPGSIHDARLLRKSNIYIKAQEDPTVFGKYFLLGDSAYPSLQWLVPPFKDNGVLSNNQKVFNFKHSSCRIVVEHTFGLLKGRFRRLQKLDNININTSVKIIMVCCVLHNICQLHKDKTVFEPYNVSDQVGDQPEDWADYVICDKKREEVFNKMFPSNGQ